MALNQRQKLFIAEYLVDGNATKAATRAGYSPKTAYAQGHALLKKPEIAAALAENQAKAAEKAGITAAMVMERLWEEAHYYDDGSSHSARVSALSALLKHIGNAASPERALRVRVVYDDEDD